MAEKRRLFYCYSERLKRALEANGFVYISTDVHAKTETRFWVFEGTEELNYYKDNIYQTERDRF